ncbi:hypothetical protein [Streptomyces sp. 4F14]|uniref:hypothetical protein n=1 Tax=Streptomyces sp. 4F14 TaxID=3394380 RepID=UPI003A8C5B1D
MEYEAVFGITADVPVDEWNGHEPQALGVERFEAVWVTARAACLTRAQVRSGHGMEGVVHGLSPVVGKVAGSGGDLSPGHGRLLVRAFTGGGEECDGTLRIMKGFRYS